MTELSFSELKIFQQQASRANLVKILNIEEVQLIASPFLSMQQFII